MGKQLYVNQMQKCVFQGIKVQVVLNINGKKVLAFVDIIQLVLGTMTNLYMLPTKWI
jgi:hypothetical protein